MHSLDMDVVMIGVVSMSMIMKAWLVVIHIIGGGSHICEFDTDILCIRASHNIRSY